MAIQTGIERYTPREGVVLPENQVIKTSLHVHGKYIELDATADFPPSDPWSVTMRREIVRLSKEGVFKGKPLTEFGIGDGRNIVQVGRGPNEVLGVDIEQWRLQVAGANLVTGKTPVESPVELWRADAVTFLKNLRETGRNRLSGWTIMCLPQSPEGQNTADRYNGSHSLDSYRSDWDESGLTLNAGTLDALREVAEPRLRALIILSDRVPLEFRDRMISKTGWDIQRKFQTREPIQQDPDTGISWTTRIDDGGRFFERVVDAYKPISAVEAESRRLQSVSNGKGRNGLNVYHHLTVYQLKPSGNQ